ncbi:MAG TPA: hypothetical protein PKI68_04835 [Pontiellaceae bacterium]|nr:hypothetical protein [Pontiellaceae bacterium]
MKIKSAGAFAGLLLACGLPALFAQADVKALVTYDRNAVVSVVNPAAQADALILAQGTLPFARISRMEFEFGDGLTAQKCESLFKNGAFDPLEKLLADALMPVNSFVRLPGNLDVYLTWQMKVQFWNGHYAEMAQTVDLLKRRNAPSAGLAGIYSALALIEQNRPAEAAQIVSALDNAEAISAPAALFVRARLAMAKKEHREALQMLARIVVLHDKDPEWMPAATLYEGLIYSRTGCPEAAGNIANELIGKYPDGYWSRRAAELK